MLYECDNEEVKRHWIFHTLFFLLLVGYTAIGFFVYRDYGVPIDEYSQIDIGRVNYERITKGSLEIQTHYDRYYGPSFEVPLYVFGTYIGPVLGLDMMGSRRLFMFLFFAVSLVFFYRLLLRLFSHPMYALIGTLLLLCTPRMFAESFYNTKDIAFMSAVIFVLWAFSRTRTRSYASLIPLLATTGFALAMRAQGLLVMGIVMIALLLSDDATFLKRIRFLLLYAVSALAVAGIMSPIFWNDTIKNIIGYWQSSANPIGVPTYYFGKSYISPQIPWHYHFVWVAFSSLLSVVVTSVLGLWWYVGSLRINQNSPEQKRTLFTMGCIIVGTFLTSVFFHPRSYDGWRHIYYIYPCMIGFSVYSIRTLFSYRKMPVFRLVAWIIISVMSVDVFSGVVFMARNHPNQYLYFNILSGGYARAKANFDFDYWGISYKQLFSYLQKYPVYKTTHIYYEQVLPFAEFVMIPELRKRGLMTVETPEEADLYISIHRDIKVPPPKRFQPIYSVQVEHVDVSTIYASDTYLK